MTSAAPDPCVDRADPDALPAHQPTVAQSIFALIVPTLPAVLARLLWRARPLAQMALAATLLSTASCATTGPKIAEHLPPRPALVLMDLQAGLLGPEAGFPVASNHVEPVLAAANRAVAAARRSQIDVVYVRNEVSRWRLPEHIVMGGALAPGSQGAQLDSRLDGTAGPQFVKTAPDAFSNAEFDAYLRERRVTHVLVAGVMAPGCVYWTIRGALNRGYGVTVLADAIGARSDADLHEAMEDYRALGVQLAATDSALAVWLRPE